MPKGDFVFTSESVSEGHPDKVSDRISDAVVDAYLTADPNSRVACETMTTTNRVVIAGEVRGPDSVTKSNVEEIARHAIKDIGYEQAGFHWENSEVEVHLHLQSTDIAQGVDAAGNKDEAPAIRESCLVTPARRRRFLCPLPYIFRMRSCVPWPKRAIPAPNLGSAPIRKVRSRFNMKKAGP